MFKLRDVFWIIVINVCEVNVISSRWVWVVIVLYSFILLEYNCNFLRGFLLLELSLVSFKNMNGKKMILKIVKVDKNNLSVVGNLENRKVKIFDD